jgi:hypothetical protein
MEGVPALTASKQATSQSSLIDARNLISEEEVPDLEWTEAQGCIKSRIEVPLA